MKSRSLFILFTFMALAFAPDTLSQERGGPSPILIRLVGNSRDTTVSSRHPSRNSVTSTVSAPEYRAERRVFGLINDARRDNGLAPFQWDDGVAALARSHSQDMAQYRFFSHRGTDGQTADGRAIEFGIADWRGIAENIASMKGHDDPAAVALENWMQSSSHKKNLLSERWNQSAIGIAAADDGTYYLTQVFMLR